VLLGDAGLETKVETTPSPRGNGDIEARPNLRKGGAAADCSRVRK
jgi:hypothetical protein